jgi:hypothetical protein
MTDDLERRLQEGLRSAPLPIAPEALRGYLANLPLDVQPSRATRRLGRSPVLLGIAAIVILALGIGSVFVVGTLPAATPSLQPTAPPAATSIPSAGLSLEPTAPPAATSIPSAGFRTFTAPGIRFDYPAGWTDQTGSVAYPSVPGIRLVALLARGIPVCPPTFGSVPTPTPKSEACQIQATAPGSMVLSVMELTHQLPGTHGRGTQKAVAGYPAWETPASLDPVDPAWLEWTILAPDGGFYIVSAGAPRADLAARKADVKTLLASLRLSAWEPPPQVVDGHVHLDLPQGFSFDYPAGWIVYYPQDASMTSSGVVTVTSRPVAPPCTNDSCQRFTTPPETVAIEFRVGALFAAPNWSDATATIAGQPAFRQDWGPSNVTRAHEGHTWSVRLTDRTSLEIMVSLRGPNLPALRAAMEKVLASIRIAPQQSPAP